MNLALWSRPSFKLHLYRPMDRRRLVARIFFIVLGGVHFFPKKVDDFFSRVVVLNSIGKLKLKLLN